MKRTLSLLGVAALALGACDRETTITALQEQTPKPAPVALPALRQTRLYEVTIENLTTGQPFSPGVMLTHDSRVTLFTVGQTASEGIKIIAESGDEAPAAKALDGQPGVGNLMRIETPTVPMNFPPGNAKPNKSVLRITAPPGADRLSLAVMLTCTNDGFTGVSSMTLPMGFDAVSATAIAYDARAEVNNEQSAFIVPGCSAFGPANLPLDGNRKAPEQGVIVEHPGIKGIADLKPAVVGWTGPVLRVTVQRVQT